VPVYCASEPSPLLAVTGLLRPRIFVAQRVVEKLSSGELFAAIAHELAHVSALDNLKQLVLKTTRPPEWFKLFRKSDALWLNASEMAADEGALAGGASALELSSALIKVGRLSRNIPVGDLIAASHLLPLNTQSCIEMRVDHLRKLLESEGDMPPNQRGRRNYWPVLGLSLLLGYAICVNAVLPCIHEVLEFLVR
jgi:Zn-dependent protease with chaperone function